MNDFSYWELVSTLISSASLYCFVMKILFNLYTKNSSTGPIKFDLWTQLDVISAVATMLIVRTVAFTEPQDLI